MMLFLCQLKYRMATLEVMAQHQTSRFKLRQHSIDRGQPNIITGFQKLLVNIFRAQMMIAFRILSRFRSLKNAQNLDPWQGDLESYLAQLDVFWCHAEPNRW